MGEGTPVDLEQTDLGHSWESKVMMAGDQFLIKFETLNKIPQKWFSGKVCCNLNLFLPVQLFQHISFSHVY